MSASEWDTDRLLAVVNISRVGKFFQKFEGAWIVTWETFYSEDPQFCSDLWTSRSSGVFPLSVTFELIHIFVCEWGGGNLNNNIYVNMLYLNTQYLAGSLRT